VTIAAIQWEKPLPKAKKIEQPTARPRTVKAKVSSPTVPGATETVRRVQNTIEWMLARRQLDKRSFRVAEMLLDAHHVIYGSIGNNLDMDRISGRSAPGSPPPPTYMLAAERLSDAKKSLCPKVYRVVTKIVIAGYTIEQMANEIANDGRRVGDAQVLASKYEREKTGKVLKEGLGDLAKRWIPDHEGSRAGRVVGFRTPDARPDVIIIGPVDIGGTAHASGHRVVRN